MALGLASIVDVFARVHVALQSLEDLNDSVYVPIISCVLQLLLKEASEAAGSFWWFLFALDLLADLLRPL
jgi:hypothetical protein